MKRRRTTVYHRTKEEDGDQSSSFEVLVGCLMDGLHHVLVRWDGRRLKEEGEGDVLGEDLKTRGLSRRDGTRRWLSFKDSGSAGWEE